MSKVKAFNISMPIDLVEQIDKQSQLQASNRSEFIRQAVRKQLLSLEQWRTVASAARSQYKGKAMSEDQVSKLISTDRSRPT